MMKHLQILLYTTILLLAASCGINQKEILPEDGFLKIYNHPDEHRAYYPSGVLELPEGGYIMASAIKEDSSEVEYPHTSLICTDERGVLHWTMEYNWLAPAPGLFLSGGLVGLVAMDGQLNAHLLLIEPAGGEITSTVDLGMTLPLVTHALPEGGFLLLGYDFVSRSSWIGRYNGNNVQTGSTMLPVNTDLALMIQRHMNKSGESLPFFIGTHEASDGPGYFISCFYNYTLRTVFLEESSLAISGDLFSYQTNEAVSSLIYKGMDAFGATGYYEAGSYILPHGALDVSNSHNIKEYALETLYELTSKAEVHSTLITDGADRYMLVASQTNANTLVIYQYAVESDSLVATHHHAFDNRLEVTGIIPTSDNGVAVLAGTHVAGKYRRTVVLKEPGDLFFPEE